MTDESPGIDYQALLTQRVKDRIRQIRNTLSGKIDLPKHEFMIAGGCFKNLAGSLDCDIDLFPYEDLPWESIPNARVTPNAQTLTVDGVTVQFCNFPKSSLKELVDSFDFSYCKCGMKIGSSGEVEEVYFTEDWVKWFMTREVTYTPGKYPLSSLMRLGKLYKKGMVSALQYRLLVLEILYYVAKRGFQDGADLKEQLNAVDLSMEIGTEHYRLLDVLPPK